MKAMHFVEDELWFPHPSEANEDGILAVGGTLTTERLLLAYHSGIFPWYEDDQPVLWWSPNPRMVLFPLEFKVSKSLKKLLRTTHFRVTFNTAFDQVIHHCAKVKREGQRGTWITSNMQAAYIELNRKGIALSVEVWDKEELIGGLYGVDLKEKKMFCGESMFAKQSNASKVAFYHLVKHLIEKEYRLIDCQVYTAHLESLGAREISRVDFLKILNHM